MCLGCLFGKASCRSLVAINDSASSSYMAWLCAMSSFVWVVISSIVVNWYRGVLPDIDSIHMCWRPKWLSNALSKAVQYLMGNLIYKAPMTALQSVDNEASERRRMQSRWHLPPCNGELTNAKQMIIIPDATTVWIPVDWDHAILNVMFDTETTRWFCWPCGLVSDLNGLLLMAFFGRDCVGCWL